MSIQLYAIASYDLFAAYAVMLKEILIELTGHISSSLRAHGLYDSVNAQGHLKCPYLKH